METVTLEKKLVIRESKKVMLFKKNKNEISNEDAEIITALQHVGKALHVAQMSFNSVSNDILIDSFIYEIMALNKRYDYYIKICKERGLIAEGFEDRGVK